MRFLLRPSTHAFRGLLDFALRALLVSFEGKNKLVQQLFLKKIITLNKENKAKVNLVEDQEDSNFGRGNNGNFAIGDINFDGFDDLVLADSNEGGYGSSTYSIFLYHPESRKFIKSKEFTEKLGQSNTGLFDIDRKAKTLTTGWKDGCCFYQANTWQVQNNKLVLVQKVTEGDEQYLAWLKGENPSNYNQDIYVTITRELIHGKWVTLPYNSPGKR
jgi:hypothetical protein